MKIPDVLDMPSLLAAYRDGLQPLQMIEQLLPRLADDSHGVWISRVPEEKLRAMACDLSSRDPSGLPLYGLPFVIKDNIDLAGLPTTAACAAFSYEAGRSAPVVAQLIAAGAIPLGKTNLDQFATGLNGTRSPYGVCRNAFNPDFIAGGSSSGSAVAVALGLCSFSLGTDTAGSGRVPAAFNNLVGLKPTRGVLSSRGVVPACRSLDSVSIFARTAQEARAVFDVVAFYDDEDEYARPLREGDAGFTTAASFRLGVPRHSQREFAGDAEYGRLFAEALKEFEAQGAVLVEIDMAPFFAAARLLYAGPWVAERAMTPQQLLREDPAALLPVIRDILRAAESMTATDTFAAQHQLARLKREADRILASVDVIVTPTAPTIFRISEIEAEPVARNSVLGTYTNFMNLLDYAAVAVPAGFRPDGLPFGVTFFAAAHQDRALLKLAQHLGR
jgi:allophanate hydrolase